MKTEFWLNGNTSERIPRDLELYTLFHSNISSLALGQSVIRAPETLLEMPPLLYERLVNSFLWGALYIRVWITKLSSAYKTFNFFSPLSKGIPKNIFIKKKEIKLNTKISCLFHFFSLKQRHQFQVDFRENKVLLNH